MLRKRCGGKREFKDIENNLEHIFDMSLKLKNDTIIFQFHKVAKRIINGEEDSLHFYGMVLKNIDNKPSSEVDI